MEESDEENFLKTDEKPESGFPSPPPSPTFDLAELEKLIADLQNLESKEDDANSCETASVLKEEKKRKFHYPRRPGLPDCTFYMRTGTCKFGSNCKYNHRRGGKEKEKDKQEKEKDKEEKEDGGNEENEKEDFHGKERLQECKYYLKAGRCKFGKACRFNHSRQKAGAEEPGDLNFLGLPIRPGQRECPFYMLYGSCKFAINCRFHHPDPTAVGGADPPPVYQNGTSLPLDAQPASPSLPTDWSSQTTSNESAPYMEVSPPPYQPVMMSRLHGVHQMAEWNEQMPASRSLPTDCSSQTTSNESAPYMEVSPPPYQPFMTSPLHGVHPMAEWNEQMPASPSLPTDWCSQTTSNESTPYMDVSLPPYQPVMMSPLHGMAEWNEQMGLASPLASTERHIQAPSVSPVNDMTKKADRTTSQMQKKAKEFPERPGQPGCKFKSAHRHHHPRKGVSKSTASVCRPMGLPLRPDKNICVYYIKYGNCKFGPSCRFDHPINSGPLAAPATHASHQPSSLEKSTSEQVDHPINSCTSAAQATHASDQPSSLEKFTSEEADHPLNSGPSAAAATHASDQASSLEKSTPEEADHPMNSGPSASPSIHASDQPSSIEKSTSKEADHPINSGPSDAPATHGSDQPSSLEKSTSEEAGGQAAYVGSVLKYFDVFMRKWKPR